MIARDGFDPEPPAGGRPGEFLRKVFLTRADLRIEPGACTVDDVAAEDEDGAVEAQNLFGDKLMSSLADYISAALMLRYNQRTVG